MWSISAADRDLLQEYNVMNRKRSNLVKEPIRVLVVARHPMVQEGFKLLIEANREIVVAATRSFEDKFDESEIKTVPDVVVVFLGATDRVEVISELLHEWPDLRVVVTVASDNLELQATALELGAVGIVHEEQNPNLLIEAIRQTFAGETWLNQVLLNKILQRNRTSNHTNGKRSEKFDPELGFETLTSREFEVLDLIGNGLKNKQIAERLLISEPTVRCHLSSIYGKLGVDDRLNLVIKAYQRGLLDVSQSPKGSDFPIEDLERI